MADDIVTRLRKQQWQHHSRSNTFTALEDAADEIERLRKRLQACQSNDDYELTDDCITQNERFLLAEVERLGAENATLRQNEWRLIWGLCTNCGRNREQEARRER